MSTVKSIVIKGYGFTVNKSDGEEIRRAEALVAKYPDLFKIDCTKDEDVFCINSTDQDLFNRVRNWVKDNNGEMP